jgi:hypothetical protein
MTREGLPLVMVPASEAPTFNLLSKTDQTQVLAVTLSRVCNLGTSDNLAIQPSDGFGHSIMKTKKDQEMRCEYSKSKTLVNIIVPNTVLECV